MENDQFHVDLSKIALGLTNQFFGLILLPTEKCNFRCTYCYEDYKLGRMSSETVGAIKQLIDKRTSDGELEYLHIGWFGGEPLLEKNMVTDILSYAKKCCEAHQIDLLSDMTTNGYFLKKDVFDRLVSLNLNHFQISLDGPKELHDLTRIKADKSGTFDIIWQNLLAMRENKEDFSIILRIHIMPENVEHIKKLIIQIGEAFGGDKRFKLFIRGISNLGGENSKHIKIVGQEKQKDIMAQMNELAASKNVAVYRLETAKKGGYVCYASWPNQLVIRADGSIAKCTVAFDDDVNHLGKINADGTLQLDNKKLNFWARGVKSIDVKTLKCPHFTSKTCRQKGNCRAGQGQEKQKRAV